MLGNDDVAYYRRRAADERKLAEQSEDEHAAAVHEELARKYEALVARAEARPRLLIIAHNHGGVPEQDIK
jgi:hypothetical protein